MNHTATVFWKKNRDGAVPAPDITYAMVFRIVVMPNISFMANNSFTCTRGRFGRFNGRISASTVF